MLQITFRHLIKNKTFSIVNILGLTLGLTCFLVISLYVENELSYDRFHSNPERIFRIAKDFVTPDGTRVPDATTPPALAVAVRNELPEVENVTRFVANRGRLFLLQADDKRFYETQLLRVDPYFFKVFDFEFVAGSRTEALTNVHSILLTESTARKYFGTDNALGKTIRMNVNNGTDYLVTAVLKDVPSHSHFTFDVIIPFESTRNPDSNWDAYVFHTYAKLKEGTNPKTFESKVVNLFRKHQPKSLNDYYIQPLTDIHLYSDLKLELGENGDIFNVKILITIAVFVLVIAGINYVNLTTAQSTKRAKEVGVRKVTGALKRTLISQFIFESTLMAVIAMALAIIATSLLLPFIQNILEGDLSLLLTQSFSFSVVLPLCAVLIGVLAGLYPAFYLSSIEPLKILRGSFIRSHQGIRTRQLLVIFQFTISCTLIIGTLIVGRQLDYIQQKKLGFNPEQILMLPNVRGGINGATFDPAPMLEEMKHLTGVKRIARGDGVFGSNNSVNGVTARNQNRIALNFIRIDYDFLPAMEIGISEGRNFSEDFLSDKDGIILNKEAVAQLGLQQPYIGQPLAWDDDNGTTRDVTLVGVVEDFHFTSMRETIKPFGFILEVGNGSTFFLKLESQNLGGTLAAIEKVWTKYSPEKPFEYTFQDEQMAKLHLSEARFQKLFSLFTTLAILIACMGLFGLAVFMAEAKTKEIGIRKVIGASIPSVVGLLSKDFLKLVIAAVVVSIPLASYGASQWLDSFAYKTEIEWWIFAVTALIAVAVTVVTIGFQAVKAAMANPVEALRNE